MRRELVLEMIAESVGEVLSGWPGRPLADGESLADLGANSVDRAEIIAITLEKLGVRMPMARLAQSRDLGELADAIRGHA